LSRKSHESVFLGLPVRNHTGRLYFWGNCLFLPFYAAFFGAPVKETTLFFEAALHFLLIFAPMSEIAKYIEHTILKPDATLQEIKRLCEEALQYNFSAVCVPPFYVRDARRILGEPTKIRIVTVVGFPMGYSAMAAKSEEIKRAVDDGADDIDAVINLAAVKSENWNYVSHDIDSIARATYMRGKRLKLILESGLLTEPELKRLIEIAVETRIDWLKTGTGFHNQPATPRMVQALRRLAPAAIKIKTAGGIGTLKTAGALIEAGANALGTSDSVSIMQEL
jgi:deoxyribose-phosphate aldolase